MIAARTMSCDPVVVGGVDVGDAVVHGVAYQAREGLLAKAPLHVSPLLPVPMPSARHLDAVRPSGTRSVASGGGAAAAAGATRAAPSAVADSAEELAAAYAL